VCKLKEINYKKKWEEVNVMSNKIALLEIEEEKQRELMIRHREIYRDVMIKVSEEKDKLWKTLRKG
jgi:hypothetical protein